MTSAATPSPWAGRLWTLLAGLAAGFAHPPFGVLPGLLGYGLLVAMLDHQNDRRRWAAFCRGWLAGVGYFSVGCWWIVEPFFVDAKNQAWMAPIALPLMAGGLALFWGAAAGVYRLCGHRGMARIFVFAGALALFEWLRGHVLTGFPWDLPGETWAAGSMPSQAASLVGAYGLSWFTIALACAPVLLFDRINRLEKLITGAVILGFLGLLYAFGAVRLAHAPNATAAGTPLIRVVQADIDQKSKWKPENLAQIFDTYVTLSRRQGPAHPDIVVWPEGALPAVIDELLAPESPYGPRLRDALDPGQTLLMGANRAQLMPDGSVAYFNSLAAFRREANGLRVTGVYDKHRLVPFGEYMPLGALAAKVGFRSLVHMPDDFTAGPPARPLSPIGVPALQPVICYEALFPGFTRDAARRAGQRPAWILNISNDAWFGQTSGPLQHLNLASYRAIEEGLPIVRATPTGVSAAIDAFGRVQPGKRLGLGDLGVIDARLPAALPPTPFERFGDLPFALMLVLSALVALADRVHRPVID